VKKTKVLDFNYLGSRTYIDMWTVTTEVIKSFPVKEVGEMNDFSIRFHHPIFSKCELVGIEPQPGVRKVLCSIKFEAGLSKQRAWLVELPVVPGRELEEAISFESFCRLDGSAVEYGNTIHNIDELIYLTMKVGKHLCRHIGFGTDPRVAEYFICRLPIQFPLKGLQMRLKRMRLGLGRLAWSSEGSELGHIILSDDNIKK
jgi:hypothetical protein